MVAAIRATSRWPLLLKLICAVLGTFACFIVQLPIEARSFGDPFAVFLGCVFIVALLFGRAPGGVAIVLASILSILFFQPFGSLHLLRAFDLIQIEIFALLATGGAVLADQIRRTLIAISDQNLVLVAEDTRKTLRLQEVGHRIANSFSSLDALIHHRARLAGDPTMTVAFEQASELVHVIARLSKRLNVTDDSTVNSGEFVRDVCDDLKACAPPTIAFACDADSYDLPLGIAVPVGLVINELVTNALKYAFPDGRAGCIRVVFTQRHANFILAVEDDGSGMTGSVQGGGAGLLLLNGLARSLDGKFDVNSSPAGTRAVVTFPAPTRVARETAHVDGHLH